MADSFFQQPVRSRADAADERVHVKIVGNNTSSASGAVTESQAIVDSDGSIQVSLQPSASDNVVSEFNSITAVASGINTTLITYTVPVSTIAYLQRIELSGNNIATYEIYIDAVLSGKKRTYFGGSLNETFDFDAGTNRGLKLIAGTVVQLKVLHNRPDLGDFEARLQAILTT